MELLERNEDFVHINETIGKVYYNSGTVKTNNGFVTTLAKGENTPAGKPTISSDSTFGVGSTLNEGVETLADGNVTIMKDVAKQYQEEIQYD